MIAFDEDAKLKHSATKTVMGEKQPCCIHVKKPMEHGVISDYTNMRYLLGTYWTIISNGSETGLMIAVPVILNVEKRAFEDLAWEISFKG